MVAVIIKGKKAWRQRKIIGAELAENERREPELYGGISVGMWAVPTWCIPLSALILAVPEVWVASLDRKARVLQISAIVSKMLSHFYVYTRRSSEAEGEKIAKLLFSIVFWISIFELNLQQCYSKEICHRELTSAGDLLEINILKCILPEGVGLGLTTVL